MRSWKTLVTVTALAAGTAFGITASSSAQERISAAGTAYPSTPDIGDATASRGGTTFYGLFTCPAGGHDCHGTVEVLTNPRFTTSSGFRRQLTIGFEERHFYAPSGDRDELALKLPTAACNRLRREGKLGITMTVRLRRPSGADKVVVRRDVLRIGARSGGCPGR